MKKFYVVGSNSSKSLSPTIFNYWFKKYKIDAQYNYLQLNKKNFDKKITNTLKDKDVKGLNITIPFKKNIIKHTETLDVHSKRINAVNCVSIKSKIKGINTDWIGYYKTIPNKKNLKNKNVLLIGYGGAALAIHYVLKSKGFNHLTILNRTKRKLRFVKKTQYTKSLKLLDSQLKYADFIINTTPKNPINSKRRRLVKKNALLSDIVYKPKETTFLKNFPKNKKIYGISMLIEQAVPCFELWFGIKPSIDQKLIKILDKKIK